MNISFIIPTYNRNTDLKRCLDCLQKQIKHAFQIIIINNAKNTDTNKLVQTYDLPILCHHHPINSWAQARNRWIEHLNPKTDIVLFIDDDTTFWPEFLQEIETFFLKNPQAKWGVAHITSPVRTISILKKIGFFLLTWWVQRNKQFVTQWWFNALPFIQWNKQQQVERTSGCAMFFHKSIFDEWFRFPEKFLKYSLMEDCFLSYAIHTTYPSTLWYVPSVKIIHHESPQWRIAKREKIMQNIIHRYLFIQHFKLSVLCYIRTTVLLWILDLMTYKSLSIIKRYAQWFWYIVQQRKTITNADFDYNAFIFNNW
jgi:glycosyltransferase involved in cell wall biosynthesis